MAFLVLAFVLGFSTSSSVTPNLPPELDKRFDTTLAWKHIMVLAADSMRGRYTPSPELDKSAQYIANTLESYGIEPVDGSYFHEYYFDKLDLASPPKLSIEINGVQTSFTAKTDFNAYEMTGEESVDEVRVVFVGYGITAPEFGYDDYKNIDADGAVVVLIKGEPHTTDTTKPFSGRSPSAYGSTTSKYRNAIKHGAAGVFVVDALRPGKKPIISGARWPSLYPDASKDHNPISLSEDENTIPCIHLGEQPIVTLFGSLQVLRDKVHLIDSLLVPQSYEMEEVTASCEIELLRERQTAKNVVGLLKGSAKQDEFVVIGAHYDHVGVGSPMNGDSIFNGADDNASGTTGVLLAANVLASGSQRPERSIVFVAFSGEERGLLGSKAFTNNPPLELSNCVAMLNMDMIGRCENNKLSIGGAVQCPDLAKINVAENESLEQPLSLAYDIDRYFFRSDQANFARQRIPVLFYFTGEHKDYHRVTDDVSKISMGNMVSIIKLATHVAWRAANQERTRYVPSGWEE